MGTFALHLLGWSNSDLLAYPARGHFLCCRGSWEWGAGPRTRASCAQRVLETGFDPGTSALRRPVLSSALEGPGRARAPLPRRLRERGPTGRNRVILRGCGDWGQPTIRHAVPLVSALRGVRSRGVCPPTPVIPCGVPKEWVRERLNPVLSPSLA